MMMMMALAQIFLVTLYLTTLTSADILIVSNNCTSIFSNNCHNLSYYLRDPSLYLTSHSVLTFLEGTHSLTEPIVIHGVTNLTLRGEGQLQDGYHWTVRQSTVMIKCANYAAGLIFVNSSVNIEMITLTDCGMSINDHEPLTPSFEPFFYGFYKLHYDFKVYLNLHASLVFMHSSNVTLSNVSIQNCTGFCMFSLNTDLLVLSEVYISHTSPTVYRDTLKCCDIVDHEVPLQCIGGNLILFYLHLTQNTTNSIPYNLTIINSILSFGAGLYNITDSSTTMSGLTIIDISMRPLYAYIKSVLLFENNGGNLGGLTTEAIIGFDNITSMGANKYICSSTSPGLSFKISITNEVSFARRYANLLDRNQTRTILFVNNSRFLGNLATDSAGMNLDTSLIVPFLPIVSIYYVTINNSFFSGNMASFGSCIGIGGTTPISVATLVFELINVIFDENYFDSSYLLYNARELRNPYKGVPPSCLAFGNTINATFQNVTIANHKSLAIYAYNTFMILRRYNEIRNNSGQNGGGLMLLGSSNFLLESSTVSFIDNRAERGAAIFISLPRVSSVSFPFCQYQVNGNVTNTNSMLVFSGNEASITGNIIYGSDINGCLLFTNTGVTDSSEHFTNIFNYTDNLDPGYDISSDAKKVCFCFDNHPYCNVTQVTLEPVFPGQTVSVVIATIGVNDGFTTGDVNVRYNDKQIGRLIRNHLPRCFNMTLPNINNLIEIGSNITMSLSIEDPFDGDVSDTRTLVIPIAACPPGFSIQGNSFTCECDEIIAGLDTGVECDIESETISHKSFNWIGFSDEDNCVLVANHCPFDYCRSTNVTFNIHNPNVQCALNRTGILCGGCAEGLSLMLGSNKCGHCSDNYIALLLVFIVAGLALVILLIVLNLTVTMGTINGLIFYANIIKINQPIFFPNGPIPFLSQFISWINLDLGIEVCFYDGMNPTQKVWLQYVFPLYIWIIIGVIIIACRYSTKLSSLVGSNAVPVLATLVLLSYVKIIRTYILALKQSTLSCGTNTQLTVWSVNGNDSYVGSSHIWLILFSILVLLVTVIPYSLFVIMIPLMERYSNSCGRLWLRFLKPISDAYCGPYKDKFRFWAGLLLLARLVIANSVPFISEIKSLLLIICVTFFLLFFFADTGGPHKSWYLNVLELWFLLHVLFVCTFALSHEAVIGTSISITFAFLTFVLIVCGHVFVRLREFKSFQSVSSSLSNTAMYLKKKNRSNEKIPVTIVGVDDEDYPRFRESLLQNEPYDIIEVSRSILNS